MFKILEELKVEKVIIGKQFEVSANYEKFVQVVKERNIKMHIAEAGQRINIEKDIYFNILWPDSKNVINENIINNNSLVCKLVYKNFSMLFTGDIEEIAEKSILNDYSANLEMLESTVLKVAHHGSKTSSTKEFLEAVNPKKVLIGVGKNNKFGHPSEMVLDKLQAVNCEIYRTDENGEISIWTNGRKIRVEKFIDN